MSNSYAKFKHKHFFLALFSPTDFIEYQKLRRKNLPRKYILTFHHATLHYFLRKYKPRKIPLYSLLTIYQYLLTIYQYKGIGLVRMIGIGSSHAAAVECLLRE